MQAWSNLANFPAKFRFRKQPGEMNRNAEGQFVAKVFEVRMKAFSQSTSHFLRNSLSFAKSLHTTQLLLFGYLRQLMLSQKALRHALSCPLYSTFGIQMLHMHSC